MDTISIGGDLRLRYQYDSQDNGVDRDRDRLRVRGRIEVVDQFSEDLMLGFRLVTGDRADAVTTNQTFENAFDKTDVWFDKWYAQYTPNEWFTIVGGKFSNPFVCTPMLFDPDVNPEGFGQVFQFGDEMFDCKLILGELMVGEAEWDNDAWEDDIWLLAGQLGADICFADEWVLAAYIGYYDYTDIDEVWTVDDVNIFQPHLALTYTGVEDTPMTAYGEYVENEDADDDEAGWRAGIGIGAAEMEGSWEVGAFYQQLEANAVLPQLTDSDFHGGGTNNEGFGITAAYAIRDNWLVRGTALLADEESGPDDDYDTYQLDMVWEF